MVGVGMGTVVVGMDKVVVVVEWRGRQGRRQGGSINDSGGELVVTCHGDGDGYGFWG